MTSAKQYPSAKDLLAIAEAGKNLADGVHHSPLYWDPDPTKIPFQILVRRNVDERVARTNTGTLERVIARIGNSEPARSLSALVTEAFSLNGQLAGSVWDYEFVDEIIAGACGWLGALMQLHELLVKVWPSYLGSVDNVNSWSDEERDPMPDTVVTGWSSGVVLALRGLQRDVASIERASSEGERTGTPPREVLSAALVNSIRSFSRELRRHGESVGEKEPQTRDAWIYRQAEAGKTWKWIRTNITLTCAEWDPVETDGGIKYIVDSFAEKNDLPKPPSRRPGRPRNTK